MKASYAKLKTRLAGSGVPRDTRNLVGRRRDGEYEAIPVYSFAQLDSDHSDTYPIQLVLIDARDGSEVSMVQDEARFLNK